MERRNDERRAPQAPRPLEEMSTGARHAGAAAGDAGAGSGSPSSNGRLLLARRPPATVEPTLWNTTVRWIVGAAVTVLLAWLTYSLGGWIPILSGFDLGVHEFGHLLTFWAPPLLCSLAGSLLQVAAPLGLAGYFWWRRDELAVILMVAWAGESLHNVSVYIGDAEVMVLPLFGDDGSGAGHDWHNILGQMGWLDATDPIANVVMTLSVILFVVAFGLAALGFVRSRREPADR